MKRLSKAAVEKLLDNAITDAQILEITKVLLLYEILSEVKKIDKTRHNSNGGD